MNLTTRRPIAVILTLAGLFFAIWLCTNPALHKKHKSAKSYFVTVTHPVIKAMPINLNAAGSVEPAQTVNVISQVTGTLIKIHVTQGQEIHQGQLLFEIDPALNLIAVKQAHANLERDQAQLTLLQETAVHYAALAKLEYITRLQYEGAKTAAKAQQAVVAADQAQLQQAQLQLNYTKIRAPISGKIGSITVHQGDLVTANTTTPLVVINRMDQVLVNFDVSQDKLPHILKAQHNGKLQVKIMDEHKTRVIGFGSVNFINNIMNQQTGMVNVKATIANTTTTLWPGQLVTVQMTLGIEPNAMTLPAECIALGQQGNFIYTVKDNKTHIQLVKISRKIDGIVVIKSGLQGNEAVITQIPPGLHQGDAVIITVPKKAS